MTMRTKHLMTAIMLPALFAACTNDDFQTIEQGNQGLDGRKMVDNVTLTVNAAADTRLAWNGTYSFEDGDEIGACLMDVVTDKYKSEFNGPRNYYLWHEWFKLTDYIHTNYKFTREDGKWTTGAKMAEGNYFFVMPYNANYGYRMAYTFDASFQTQDGTDDAALKEAYAKNNHFVGYGKVVAGDADSESVAVDMVPVFGTTGFTIENTGTQTYTIERIVLKGENIYNAAVLNPTDCTSSLQYAADLTAQAANKDFNVAQYVADPLEDYVTPYNRGGWYNPYWEEYDRIAAMKDVVAEKQAGLKTVEVALTKENTIAKNQSIRVIAVVFPQRDIAELADLADVVTGGGKIKLDIYTDKGIIKNIELNHKYTANDKGGTTTNVLTDLALTSIGTGNHVKVTFDDTSLDKPENMNVDTDDDLANLIHWQAEQGTAANIVATLEANVNITKAMYDELKSSKIASVTIKGSSTYNVTVKADVADGALDAFKFEQVNTVTVLGTQSIKKAPASPVTVYPGATLNIAGDLKKSDNNAMTAGITNYGTLNVNADVEGNISGDDYAFTNYATMTVAAGKKLDDAAKVDNGYSKVYAGEITNAGTITVLNNQEGTVTNTGVIGEEESVDEINRGKNTATIINNNGKVFLSVNTGDIYANGTSTTRLGSNKYGNLIITNLDKANGNFLTGKDKGDLVQEITADANTDAVDVRANTLWLSASLKVEKKDKDGNYEDVDLTGALMKNGAMKVVATSANARIDGNDQKFRMDAIEVNKDAKLVLNNVQMTITKEGNVTMHGEANHVATLTINSNAWLKVYQDPDAEITVVETNKGYNELDNNSSSTKIGLAR